VKNKCARRRARRARFAQRGSARVLVMALIAAVGAAAAIRTLADNSSQALVNRQDSLNKRLAHALGEAPPVLPGQLAGQK
jgi:hypothetical protein